MRFQTVILSRIGMVSLINVLRPLLEHITVTNSYVSQQHHIYFAVHHMLTYIDNHHATYISATNSNSQLNFLCSGPQ